MGTKRDHRLGGIFDVVHFIGAGTIQEQVLFKRAHTDKNVFVGT